MSKGGGEEDEEHITWSINSICHFFGSRRFDTDDQSTNVFWLALPSLGEAWHHNHHAFPQSAFHGLRWYELDPSGWLILGLAKVGLASGRQGDARARPGEADGQSCPCAGRHRLRAELKR
jgi:fatty-acid desaturase